MAGFENGAGRAAADTGFLEDLLASLRKRRKALRHQVRDLSIERIVERSEGGDRGKLEIACVASGRARLRLFAWEDRWVWFDARCGSKDGWVWQFTRDGRLLAAEPGRGLVEAMERSIAAAFELTPEGLSRLEDIWTPLLARGPRGGLHD